MLHDDAKLATPVVGMGARHVIATFTPAVHAARKTTTVDLGERHHVGDWRRGALARGEAVEERSIAMRDRRDILRTLLAPFHLQAGDARIGDVGEMIGSGEIFRRDEEAAIELGAGVDIIEYIVLPAGLRAGAAIRASLRDHARHEALAAVRNAERAVDECLETEFGHRRLDGANVPERVLARQHHALDAELTHDAGAALVMHRHLR